ncbi:MAG: histidinol-phosphatase [Thermoproteota archaeon]
MEAAKHACERMVKVNYHIHSTYSDGKATIKDYVQEAIRKDFNEIAFTEHLAVRPGSMKKLYYSIEPSKLGEYLSEVREVGKQFPVLRLKAGLEVDYFPGSEKILRDILGSYDFDFLMGSVHWIGELCLDCTKFRKAFETAVKEEGFDGFYVKYLRLLGRAVETGLFNIIAHFDVARNWGFKPSDSLKKEELSVLEKVSELKIAVEVSSKGLRNPVNEAYPTRRVFEACASMKIPITLGTDAHSLSEIDFGYDSIVEYARNMGYVEQALFEHGKLFFASI